MSRLLAHITYFDASVTAGVDSRTSAVKTSAAWRDFNFNAVVRPGSRRWTWAHRASG